MRVQPSREPEFRVLGAPNPPRTLAELIAVSVEQRGLVTRVQCLGAGMTSKAVRWRLERGIWVRVHPGVYQTLPGKDDWHTRALAAQLAVAHSVWSHRTAGFVHGVMSTPPAVIDLALDERYRVAAPGGVRIHRIVDLGSRVDDLHWPWRVDVPNTVLDLAELDTTEDALAVLGRAFQRFLVTEDQLLGLLARRSRHRRRGLLTDVLADVSAGAESVMEVRYLRDVERVHRLPGGRRQVPTVVSGLRLHDVAYDEQRVLVELDGRLGHDGAGRVRDGVRDRGSARHGWLTLRAFWTDVAVTPCQLAMEVGEVLGSRGWRGRPAPCRRRTCALRA